MSKQKKIIAIITIVVGLVLAALVFLLHLSDSAGIDYITSSGNMFIIKLNNVSYYDISTYGIDKGVYTKSDYERLKNIKLDFSDEKTENSSTVYYTDNPVLKHFLNEKIVQKNFYSNNICFITSTNDSQLFVKKNILLPQLQTENISKIVIVSVNDDISYTTADEINEFVENIDSYLKKYENDLNYKECRIYYLNSDSNIYETITIETISNIR